LNENQVSETALVKPVDTRWDSYFTMLEVVHKKRATITLTSQSPELAIPASKQACRYSKLILVLLNFLFMFVDDN
jgi:hypothetical protein